MAFARRAWSQLKLEAASLFRRRGFFRRPSIRKRVSARLSLARYVRHNMGFKAPRGWGWLTNPRRALYNRVYARTSRRGCLWIPGIMVLGAWALGAVQ